MNQFDKIEDVFESEISVLKPIFFERMVIAMLRYSIAIVIVTMTLMGHSGSAIANNGELMSRTLGDSSNPSRKLPHLLVQEPCETKQMVFNSVGDNAQDTPIPNCGSISSRRGPHTAPSRPGQIQYAAYSRGNVYVSWESSHGHGFPVRYHLEERKGYGPWVQIYSGPSTKWKVTNRSTGDYTFRIKASNSVGASAYRTGYRMTMKSSDNADLSLEYPGLKNLQQADAEYFKSVQSFKDLSRKDGQDMPASDFYLGQGFNLTEGQYAAESTCLELNNVFISRDDTPAESWDLTRIRTPRDLHRKLDLAVSPELALSIGTPELDSNGKYHLFRDSIMQQDNSRVVARWQRLAQRLSLESNTDFRIKDYWQSKFLLPYDGSDETESEFRQRCGDQFVSEVLIGARLYVLLEIGNKDLTAIDMQLIAERAKSYLETLLKSSMPASETLAMKGFFETNRIVIKVHTEGGREAKAKTHQVELTELMPLVKQFISSVTSSGYVSLSNQLASYPVPKDYSELAYFKVYKDYRENREQLKRWLALDHQVNGRCYALRDVDAQIGANKYRLRCHKARVDLGEKIEQCANNRLWNECSHPENTPLPVEFFNSIPNLYAANSPDYNTSRVNLEVKSCWACRTRAKTITAKACLPTNECLLNRAVQHTDPNSVAGNQAPKGAEVYVSAIENPHHAEGAQIIRPEADGEQCLSTSISMKTKGRFNVSTAYYRGSQSLYGRCPQPDPFLLP